jgi:hypothetical protein
MATLCHLRANLATTCFFQPLIFQHHACRVHRELSPLKKTQQLALLAAPVFSLLSIDLRPHKHASGAPLAPTVFQDQCDPLYALWASTVLPDHPVVQHVSVDIFHLLWVQHHPAAAVPVRWAPMHPPPVFQVVQDALMASSAIKLLRSNAKNVLSGSTPDLRNHHHSAIVSLVLPVRTGLKAAVHLVLPERTIPVSDQWIPVHACSVPPVLLAASDPVPAERAPQGPLHLKLDLQHVAFVP